MTVAITFARRSATILTARRSGSPVDTSGISSSSQLGIQDPLTLPLRWRRNGSLNSWSGLRALTIAASAAVHPCRSAGQFGKATDEALLVRGCRPPTRPRPTSAIMRGRSGPKEDGAMAVHADGIGPTLRLTPAQPSPVSRGALRCTLALRNQSDSAVWVNRRLAINHPISPPHLREVDFLIQDVRGHIAEFAAKVRVGLPQPEDFVELAPGETVERPFDLAFYYVLASGQEYEVQAIYENYFVPESLKD